MLFDSKLKIISKGGQMLATSSDSLNNVLVPVNPNNYPLFFCSLKLTWDYGLWTHTHTLLFLGGNVRSKNKYFGA